MKSPAAPPQEFIPPHSIEAEQSVLGALMLSAEDHEAVAQALAVLSGDCFYAGSHRVLFDAIHRLTERGACPDILTVTDAIREEGLLEEAGGAVYVTELAGSVFSPTLALTQHLQMVRRDGARRRLATLAADVMTGSQGTTDPYELAARTREALDSFSIPPLEGGPRMNRISGAALLQETGPDAGIEWVQCVGQTGVIGRGIATLFSALAKSGKTTTLLNVARANSHTTRILWLTEEPRSLWRTRLHRFPELATESFVLRFSDDGTPWKRRLQHLEQEQETDLLVVDTVRTFCGIEDENETAPVVAAIQPVIALARRKNWALVLVHHLRKTDGESGTAHAGSHSFVGLVDVAVELRRDAHAQNRRVCKAVSRFDETPSEWVVELRDGKLELLGDPKVVRLAELTERVLAVLGGDAEKTREEIAADLDPRPSTGQLHQALKGLEEDRRATAEGRGVRGDPKRWRRAKELIDSRSLL